MITIGIPAYPYVDLLDVAGPFEMFSWIPEEKAVRAVILSEDGKAVTTVNGLTFEPHHSFDDAPPLDVLWVPGGDPRRGLKPIMDDPDGPYLSYLRKVAASATWVCSVCEGALLLARAGLLDGHEATTHWAFVECLEQFPGITVAPGTPRYVVSGNRLTGGGISSGLDESLKLIELLTDTATAEDVQVTTQYLPEPPVQATLPSPGACPISWRAA
jgi:transcriptional regulator GlxA family with amidase domain